MTDIDETLEAVYQRLTAAGLRMHAGAVAYQVSVMRTERRDDGEILAYLRQVDAELAQRLREAQMTTTPEPRYPDVKTLVPLETQHITAECRDNRGRYPAWDEAVHRLLHVYEAQVHHRPGATVSVAIYVTDPQPPAGPPAPPKPPRLPRGWAVG